MVGHPKMYVMLPNHRYDGLRRWGLSDIIRIRYGHECGALVNGISAVEEENSVETSLPLHPGKNTAKRQ
jgi:hypothetical protein